MLIKILYIRETIALKYCICWYKVLNNISRIFLSTGAGEQIKRIFRRATCLGKMTIRNR